MMNLPPEPTGKQIVDALVREHLKLFKEHGWELVQAKRSGRFYLRNRERNRFCTFDDLYDQYVGKAEINSFHELYNEMTFGDGNQT